MSTAGKLFYLAKIVLSLNGFFETRLQLKSMETSLRSGASLSLAKKPVKCTLKSRKLSI